jgi:hypothetical protein
METAMNRKQRMHIVHQRLIEATRVGRPPAQQPVPSVAIDRRRITLAGLRFMGEEPHPTQTMEYDDDQQDV